MIQQGHLGQLVQSPNIEGRSMKASAWAELKKLVRDIPFSQNACHEVDDACHGIARQ
jgi:hypothetical protein